MSDQVWLYFSLCVTSKGNIRMTERNESGPFLKYWFLMMLAMPFLIAIGFPAGKWLAFFVARTFGLSV
jgi:hypothetical protein